MRRFKLQFLPLLGCPAVIAALSLIVVCPVRAATIAETSSCPVAQVAGFALPHVRAALTRNHELLIVAFGSSSTVSWMASDIGHSYPAILQNKLSQRLPYAHIAVINRGVGGQSAAQELARLQNDVLPIRPQLVIWQVGANDAIKDVDPGLFRRELQEGVLRLQQAGIDVVLMDNQRSPRVLAAHDDDLIDRELSTVADQTGAELFARSKLMDRWRAAGYPYASFVAADRLHHNDRGYRCIADALAQSILNGLLVSETGANAEGLPARLPRTVMQVRLTKG